MTCVVIDASVAVKWFVAESDGNTHAFQPPHWEAEVAAVLARLTPENAVAKLIALRKLPYQRVKQTTIYASAIELSIRLNHHLFDTLYHATAFHIPGAVCVTADTRYYEKAKDLGQIRLLADFNLPVATS
ncbi:type II toxin-antitoxin system VapC family toxin [Methylomagnum sp.]